MYSLPYFKEQDAETVMRFMREHPFVVLTGADAGGCPVATQVPVFIDEREGKLFLSGHIMRNTDHHRGMTENDQVLVIFTGAHSYISASWYSRPEQASTWNYMSVQARGRIRFTGYDDLIRILRRTTDYFENNPDSPAGFDKLPADYVASLAKAITAFEVEVGSLENTFKLSQNRDKQSYRHIMEQLVKRGDSDSLKIAEEMRKREQKDAG